MLAEEAAKANHSQGLQKEKGHFLLCLGLFRVGVKKLKGKKHMRRTWQTDAQGLSWKSKATEMCWDKVRCDRHWVLLARSGIVCQYSHQSWTTRASKFLSLNFSTAILDPHRGIFPHSRKNHHRKMLNQKNPKNNFGVAWTKEKKTHTHTIP